MEEQAVITGWVAKNRDDQYVTLFKRYCPHRNRDKGTWEKYCEDDESIGIGFRYFPGMTYDDAPQKVRVTITITDE